MSVERATEFMKHVQAHPELHPRIAAFKGRDAIRNLTALAAELGFLFSEEEYREAVAAEAKGELSEASLRKMANDMALNQRVGWRE